MDPCSHTLCVFVCVCVKTGANLTVDSSIMQQNYNVFNGNSQWVIVFCSVLFGSQVDLQLMSDQPDDLIHLPSLSAQLFD